MNDRKSDTDTEATGLIADSTDDVFDQIIAVNMKGCMRQKSRPCEFEAAARS